VTAPLVPQRTPKDIAADLWDFLVDKGVSEDEATKHAYRYLQSVDPNTTAAIQQEAAPGKLATVGLGFSQGATLGFGDELAGIVNAILTQSPKKSFGDAYREQRDETRQATAAGREAHPAEYWSGEIGAALPTLLVPGAGVARLAPEASLLTRAAVRGGTAVGTGALVAGTDAAGRSEGTLGERLKAGAEAAPYGAAAGLALSAIPGAIRLGKRGVRAAVGSARKAVEDYAGRATPAAARASAASKRALRAVEQFDLAPPQGAPRELRPPTPKQGLEVPTYQRREPLGAPQPRPDHPIFFGEQAPTRSPEVRGGERLLPEVNPTIAPTMQKLRTLTTAELVESWKNAPQALKDLLIVEFQRRHITIPDLGIRPLSLLGS
jgi:hypothetical protein